MSDFSYSSWLTNMICEKHITLRELASSVGVSDVTMSRYHTGKRIPNLETAFKIADALGVDRLSLRDFEEVLSEKSFKEVDS